MMYVFGCNPILPATVLLNGLTSFNVKSFTILWNSDFDIVAFTIRLSTLLLSLIGVSDIMLIILYLSIKSEIPA
jgi:hypothetical protein